MTSFRALVPFLCLAAIACRMAESAPAPAPAEPPPDPPPRAFAPDCSETAGFLVGAGVSDITGPAAETRMFGFADLAQETRGIHSRLKARAFVIADACTGERVVFVSTDLLSISEAVTRRVTARVHQRLGAGYPRERLMLTATHTHSGPGGYSHYMLYNMTILGFDPHNFHGIVEGITEAIAQADASLQPGRLRVGRGHLLGASINRSPVAYAFNPPEERARYTHDVDTEMTVLRVEAAGGEPLGLVSWFPVHTTSMGPQHHFISSDNKGWASDHFERAMARVAPGFIAAFANSNEGDVSPNVRGGMLGEGDDDFESTERSGRRQFDRAAELFENAGPPLPRNLDVRHAFVRFDQVKVAPRWTDGEERTTCPAALGISMIAGAEDGPGYGTEGTRCDSLVELIPEISCTPFKRACQAEKPVLLEMGTRLPYPWSPEILPIQILRIGSLALLGVPFELTTMSGRRLRETVKERLAPSGVEHVVIAGLANAYSGYVATREEYAAQHYEGASTHFGPWTLAALQQEMARLAEAMRDGVPADAGPSPRDLAEVQHTIQTNVVFDDTPPGIHFGDLHRDVAPQVSRGGVAWASFWGAHPKNDFRRNQGFLHVDREVDGVWTPLLSDADWETRFRWNRGACLGCSQVTAEWQVPRDAVPGSYRIRVGGEWRSVYGGIRTYEGLSSSFEVK